LLAGAVSQPETAVGDLPLLSHAERALVLWEWTDTGHVEPAPVTLSALFEQQVSRSPETEARVAGESTLTYHQLDARATKLACALRRQGVRTDVRVGLCLRRSVDLVVALLAVLKAGGAYVPLDPAHPQQRLSFMLREVDAAVVVTERALADALSGAPGARLF